MTINQERIEQLAQRYQAFREKGVLGVRWRAQYLLSRIIGYETDTTRSERRTMPDPSGEGHSNGDSFLRSLRRKLLQIIADTDGQRDYVGGVH